MATEEKSPSALPFSPFSPTPEPVVMTVGGVSRGELIGGPVPFAVGPGRGRRSAVLSWLVSDARSVNGW